MKNSDVLSMLIGFFLVSCVVIGAIWGLAALGSVYTVWSAGKSGEAELAHAESNRQIKTLEARSYEESAKHLANAEITRAHGVAEANKIIGNSLKENEGYLRYLWIQGLQTDHTQVIYVPTEANLPIMEAGRLK